MAETFLYLTTTGRKTGTPHKIEIWFVEQAGCYYLCAEKRDSADWVQNIQQNAVVKFYLAQGEADIVPDEQINGHASTLDDTDAKTVQVKALFDQKYNWSNGLLVEICPQ